MPMKLSGGTGAPVRVLAIPDVELPRVLMLATSQGSNKVPLFGHLLVAVSAVTVLIIKMIE